MRLRRTFFVACVLLTWIAAGSSLRAADIEVQVDPQRTFPYARVKVSGFAKPTGTSPPEVRLRFTKPGGETIDETITARSNGLFEMEFDQTSERGVWKVTAWRGASGQKAETTFEVATDALLGSFVADTEKLGASLNLATTEFKQVLTRYPDFPGKDEMLADADRILDGLRKLEGGLRDVKKQAKRLADDLEKQGDAVSVEARQETAKAAEHGQEAAEEVRYHWHEIETLIDETRNQTEWCFTFQSYYLIFDRAGLALSVIDVNIKKMLVNFAKARMKKPFPFVTATIVSALEAALEGPDMLGITKFLIGTFLSYQKDIQAMLIAKFCTEFRGTIEGEYYAELLHDETPFLTMSYDLDAQILLVFGQRKDGDPVYLKGRIQGRAENFECSMTMMPFDLADTTSPSWCRTPVPMVATNDFLIYVEGVAYDDTIELESPRSGYDFDLKTKGYYVMLSSHQPVPIPGDIEFPWMNGFWFFTRITHLSNPQVESIELKLEVEDDVSRAEREFEREMVFDETPHRKGVRIEMEMEIELCSGCP